MKKIKQAQPKKGRPPVTEKKVSKTLGILPSEYEQVKKQYGSLTKAYDAEIKPKLKTTIPNKKTKRK